MKNVLAGTTIAIILFIIALEYYRASQNLYIYPWSTQSNIIAEIRWQQIIPLCIGIGLASRFIAHFIKKC